MLTNTKFLTQTFSTECYEILQGLATSVLGNNLEEKEKKGNCKTFGVTHKRTKKKNGNGKAFCVTRKRKKLQDRLWEIFLRYMQKQKRLY